jgi:hypothetical protein
VFVQLLLLLRLFSIGEGQLSIFTITVLLISLCSQPAAA